MMNLRSTTFSCLAAAALAASLGSCEMVSTASTYEDARAAFDAGQYRIANAHLTKLLASGNTDTQVRKLQLELMLVLGDGNRAFAAIEELPESALGKTERRIATAHAHILQGAAQKTVAMYDRFLLEDLSEQDLRMLLWAHKELRQGELFEKRLAFAHSRFPKSAHINAMAADFYFDNRMAREAESYARAALEGGAEIFEAQLVAGRSAIFAGDLEKAISHYTKANALNPVSALAPANLVGLHLDLGQVDKAGEVLKVAIGNHGDYPFLQWQAARYHLMSGDPQAARDAKQRAEGAFADNPQFILLTAEIEDAFGNKGLALDNYRRFVRMAGEAPDVLRRIEELES